MMDIMDRFVDDAFTSPSSNLLERTMRSGMRTPWDVVEKENAFQLRVDMPGISKEEVKICVEDGELVIQGEHKADKTEDDEFQSKNYTVYNTRMSLPKDVKQDEIKAELKDGVLYVVVPKAQESKKKVEVQVS
ncbi:hypothetical protein O6H91_01G156500 [Diphasiastrum complanatum]|nr:hypothetical protein O6H91_01G156500 [Diphasiastrum complanatum]